MNITQTYMPTFSTTYFKSIPVVYCQAFVPVLYLPACVWSLLRSNRHCYSPYCTLWMGSTDASVAELEAWGETPANPPEHNNARQCSNGSRPSVPHCPCAADPTYFMVLRRSVGCHGSLGALEMNLHSRLSQ